MKHFIGVAAALALALAPPAPAQRLTVKGGLSYGNVSNRGLLPGNLRERTGFAVGVGIGTAGSLLSLGVEGLYAQRGVVSDNPPDARKLDYIDLPVYLRVMLPTPGVAPFAYAGPQFSFEVRCRSGSVDCPDTDRAKVTYAAVIGGGLRFSNFSFEGRYIYGLNDLKLSTVTSSDSYMTRSFMLLLGLGF
jgi:hypothetical protein